MSAAARLRRRSLSWLEVGRRRGALAPSLLSATMRYTNRLSGIRQVIWFKEHRKHSAATGILPASAKPGQAPGS